MHLRTLCLPALLYCSACTSTSRGDDGAVVIADAAVIKDHRIEGGRLTPDLQIPDLARPDLAAEPDLAGADLAAKPDLLSHPDVATVPDLAVPQDLTAWDQASAKGFLNAVSYPVGLKPDGIAAGDFNQDGAPDLAVACSGSNAVSVLLGNGDGTFQSKVDYPVGSYPAGVAAADLDADGTDDLIVVNYSANSVSVLVGKGKGTFQRREE